MKYIFLILILFSFINVNASDNLLKNAKSGILIETTTGKILYEKNINEKLSIASLTKLMGILITMESLESGKIKLDDKVIVSKNASSMGGSQIWLEVGEEITINDLIKGVMMSSANDAIVALAEYIGGSESNFVKMMNSKAKELGLKNTNFVNPTGLDEKNNYSTAYDLSIITTNLLKYPKILEFTSIYEDYLRKGTSKEFWLVNTNKIVY